jgi:hypothetical protein
VPTYLVLRSGVQGFDCVSNPIGFRRKGSDLLYATLQPLGVLTVQNMADDLPCSDTDEDDAAQYAKNEFFLLNYLRYNDSDHALKMARHFQSHGSVGSQTSFLLSRSSVSNRLSMDLRILCVLNAIVPSNTMVTGNRLLECALESSDKKLIVPPEKMRIMDRYFNPCMCALVWSVPIPVPNYLFTLSIILPNWEVKCIAPISSRRNTTTLAASANVRLSHHFGAHPMEILYAQS